MFFSDFAPLSPSPLDWKASKLKIGQIHHLRRSRRCDLSLHEKQMMRKQFNATKKQLELHSCSCHQHVCAAISVFKKQVARLTKCVGRHRLFCPTHNFFAPRVNNGIPCPLLIALFQGRERNIASEVSP